MEGDVVPGFHKVQPQVFSGMFPVSTDDYEDFRDALGKLRLNDASLFYEPETSAALGSGFRCGFLGMLHLEIIQERLEREFDLELITTAPSVVYRLQLSKSKTEEAKEIMLHNPADWPDVNRIAMIEEQPDAYMDVVKQLTRRTQQNSWDPMPELIE